MVDTQYMIEDPNVVGKNVTIEANGSIGQDTGSETSNFPSFRRKRTSTRYC